MLSAEQKEIFTILGIYFGIGFVIGTIVYFIQYNRFQKKNPNIENKYIPEIYFGEIIDFSMIVGIFWPLAIVFSILYLIFKLIGFIVISIINLFDK